MMIAAVFTNEQMDEAAALRTLENYRGEKLGETFVGSDDKFCAISIYVLLV